MLYIHRVYVCVCTTWALHDIPSFVRNGNFCVINTCYVGGGLTTTPTVQINLQEQSSPGPEQSTVIIGWLAFWLALPYQQLASTTGGGRPRVATRRRSRYNWTSLDSAHKKADWTKQEKRDPAKSEFPLFYQATSKKSSMISHHI